MTMVRRQAESSATKNPSQSAVKKDYAIQPVPFTRVRVADRFWAARLETNARRRDLKRQWTYVNY